MNHRILVADDDPDIAQLVSIYLKNEGYETETVHDGQEALEKLASDTFHLLVLDVMMPRLDGLEACRRIRETADLPILMLSAKAEDMDKVLGLMTGADDYLVKPFNPLELTARVKSLLRRAYRFGASSGDAGEAGLLRVGGLVINKNAHTAEADGRTIRLTSTEFGILYLLASYPGRVFSAEEIFRNVWKEKYFESNNTVMVHISKLRDKLEQETGAKMIVTVWGVGYKIDA